MYNLSTSKLFRTALISTILLIIIYYFFLGETIKEKHEHNATYLPLHDKNNNNNYNVWLIFTKVSERSPLRYKFHNLIENVLNVSSVPLQFHIIVDSSSKALATQEISDLMFHLNKTVYYTYYDMELCVQKISDIVQVMMPHFSSTPGTYYSDALFYISLGLYRIAPPAQSRAVLLDCDLYFKKDIRLLFEEFDGFKSTALYGLAPELTPVYRHVLQAYKVKQKSTFGEYYHLQNISAKMPHPRGFQGYNSGVVLMNLSAIRLSKEYSNVITNNYVQSLTSKYKFRGHLGDQDFYTLIGFELPHLIQTLNCGFNRQLCVWWRDHGYQDLFYYYFNCDHPIVILHGNCNTKIPKE